ncbi:hypothetical protein FALBO_7683 [Fusarium albosuccineum]|uniref:Uncharacterized protein n=1 Tax=Fusarium albosuccineum TaxID=1237068 RepID=A0A8H4L9D3_9HYPO|nr:hypothetical protein FALBO_7683 [Fusarium albosuccineum]
MEEFLFGRQTAQKAAESLTRAVVDASTPFDTDDRMRALWSFINMTAVGIPGKQDQVVQLLRTIRALPPLKVPKEGYGTGWIFLENDEAWSELPNWANDWADSINHFENCFFDGYLGQSQEQCISDWNAAVSYSARLSNTGDTELVGDWFFLLRSLACVVRVLDVEPGQHCENIKRELEPAAQVFIHAAASVLERSKAEDKLIAIALHIEKPDLTWNGDLYKLSLERWAHWKDRWAALKDRGELNQKEREFVNLALDAMNVVE